MTIELKLFRCLEFDEMDSTLAPHVDRILNVVPELNSPKTNSALEALINKIGDSEVRRRFESFISKTYLEQGDKVSSNLFSGLSETVAKERYRKLIRVFHPDRGVNEQAWLNRRSEKINKAYEGYKQVPARVVEVDLQKGVKNYSANSSNIASPKFKTSSRKNFFSRYAGQHTNFQRRIYKFIVGAFLALIGLVYLSSMDFSNNTKDDSQIASIDQDVDLNVGPQLTEGITENKSVRQSTKINVSEKLTLQKQVVKKTNAAPKEVRVKVSPQPVDSTKLVTSPLEGGVETIWVYRKYLDIDDTLGVGVTNAQAIRLRRSPVVKNGNIVNTVNKGTIFDVISIQGDWVEVLLIEPYGYLEAVESTNFSVLGSSTSSTKGDNSIISKQQYEQLNAHNAAYSAPSSHNVNTVLHEKQRLSIGSKQQAVKSNELEAIEVIGSVDSSESVDNLNLVTTKQSQIKEGINKQEVKKLLTSYRKSFVSGDLSLLNGLYMSLANETGLTGRDAIVGRYKRLFKTSKRSRMLSMTAPKISIYNNTAKIETNIKASPWYQVELSGVEVPVELMLVKTTNGLRISKFKVN